MFLKIITNWGWTMYLHKENKELFRDIISIVSERKNVTTDIVEKDYYVTMILYLLSQKEIEIIFKGGTSLSKAYGVIDRFSEDIDITFKEHLGESRRKKLKYNILKPIAEDLEIEIKNWKDIESDKNYNHYDFYYNSVSDNSNFSGLSPFVKLETALMSYSFPTERRQISNYIYDTLKNEEPELIKKYNLIPFEMSVQCINRTLADKIFAICNCNVNVCYALRTSQLFNTPNMSRSAYVAEVTKENCVACGRCVEYCPAGAVKLGQKLCTKAGTEVKYPKMPLPSEQKWGPHMWSEDYRDKNRINCYDTGTAPCKTACPAHIAVQGYLKMAAQGRFMDALALIKKENPFPAVCGHVCNRRCEDACTRGTIDEAIAIDEVKKFIAMQDLKADTRYIPKKVVPSTKGSFDEKVAIIGGGPAGLSCAFYLAEKGYKPTVFEKNEKAGGMLVYGIPSFKLEKDVVEAEIDVIHKMGVDIKTGVEVGKDITIDELKKQGYKAFYIAIGCQGSRKAGIPGEDADGVVSAVDFLKQAGYSHEYPLEGDVVVIGGGNVAIDVARTSTRVGDYNVSMFCLEDRKGMPASEEEVEEALEEGVKLDCGWGPKEILTEDGHVTGIVLKRCISVKDADGRFNPQYDENDLKTINCRHVFLSIGQSTIWGELLKGTKVQVDGVRVKADKLTYQTTDPDIFIGGDVYTGPRFAIDAIAAGKEAAISIHRYVQPHSSLTIGRNRREFIELDKNNISIESYDNSSRQVPGTDTSFNHKKSFKDAKLTFTEEQVKKETARCLGCGASVVDPNKCIGCGICTTKCEFDAIHLNRELPECSTMRKSEDKLKYILPYGAKQAIKIKFAGKKNK